MGAAGRRVKWEVVLSVIAAVAVLNPSAALGQDAAASEPPRVTLDHEIPPGVLAQERGVRPTPNGRRWSRPGRRLVLASLGLVAVGAGAMGLSVLADGEDSYSLRPWRMAMTGIATLGFGSVLGFGAWIARLRAQRPRFLVWADPEDSSLLHIRPHPRRARMLRAGRCVFGLMTFVTGLGVGLSLRSDSPVITGLVAGVTVGVLGPLSLALVVAGRTLPTAPSGVQVSVGIGPTSASLNVAF